MIDLQFKIKRYKKNDFLISNVNNGITGKEGTVEDYYYEYNNSLPLTTANN